MQTIWQNMVRKLELPSELIGKEPKVAYYPLQKRLVIYNPYRLLIYEKERIVVDIKAGKLILTGINLQLNVLLPDSLEVYGDLKQFEVVGHV